jgi:hypothetical protein
MYSVYLKRKNVEEDSRWIGSNYPLFPSTVILSATLREERLREKCWEGAVVTGRISQIRRQQLSVGLFQFILSMVCSIRCKKRLSFLQSKTIQTLPDRE